MAHMLAALGLPWVAMAIATIDPVTPASREFRGAWVATVDNIDWPSRRDLSTEQQRSELLAIIERAEKLNLNALVFQVRPGCDALYPSKLEPWSVYLTGQCGKAPEPMWDPLEFAVSECHRRGIELHAWFNPYRAWHPAAKSDPSSDHLALKRPDLAKTYGKYKWLDPGELEVQQHSRAVILDVVNRYDVDGVHIDDYFYPYQEKDPNDAKKNLPFPDDPSYAKYRAKGGKLERDDWRRKNVDDFIRDVYRDIKKAKKWVKFGISPFGIYRPGFPSTVKAGFDQYAQLYADALKWYQEGWCDYYTPQLYWAIKSAQPYADLLKWWAEQNKKKRHFWPGNYTGRIDSGNSNWPVREVLDQIRVTRAQDGATGNVHFSFKAFALDWKSINKQLLSGPYAKPAIIPESGWLGKTKFPRPKIRQVEKRDPGVSVDWSLEKKDGLRFWSIYRYGWQGWTLHKIVGAETTSLDFDREELANEGVTAVAVGALDRNMHESQKAILLLTGLPENSTKSKRQSR